MKTKNYLITLFAIFTSLMANSYAMAADSTANSEILPFIPFLVVAALGVFMFKSEAKNAPDQPKSSKRQRSTPASSRTRTAPKAKAAAPAKKAAETTSEGLTDLSINASQCQAKTAKGTQCARTSNLELLVATIKDKTYRFTTCSQHNKANFAPHPKVLK